MMAEGTKRPTMPLLPDLEVEAPLKPGLGLVEADADILKTLPEGMDAPDTAVGADVLGRLHRRREALLRREDEAHWRGLMAVALLWDVWGERTAALRVREISGDTPLTAMLLAARRPGEKEPLRLVTLEGAAGKAALGMADSQLGLIPALKRPKLASLLPARVTWYDEDNGFADPTPVLNERDRGVLMHRLNLLGGEGARRYASALMQEGLRGSRALAARDAQAEEALRARLTAVCGLTAFEGLTVAEERYAEGETVNPLLAGLKIDQPPIREAFRPQKVWLWQGKPFARSSAVTGLEAPMGAEADSALEQAKSACGMLNASRLWQGETARRMSDFLQAHADNRSLAPAAKELIKETWRQLHGDAALVQEDIELVWPWEGETAAWLVQQCLGKDFAQSGSAPFSGKLVLLPNAAPDALGDGVLCASCSLPMEAAGMFCLAIPPLSAELARVVSEHEDCLRPEDFRMEVTEMGDVAASFTLKGTGRLTFRRVYGEEELILLQPEETPTVAVWPSVAFPAGTWQAYHVYSHGAGMQVLALRGGHWEDGGAHMWSVMRTETFPRCLVLEREGECVGALLNLLPTFRTEAGAGAVASVDLGMTGTAVAMTQGGTTESLQLPCLVRTLLHGSKPVSFEEEFMPVAPVGAVLPSIASLINDVDDPLPLVDGHIGPAEQIELVQSSLKWSAGTSKAHGLHMHQTMLITALWARMHGARDMAWRIALPADLSPEHRSALMNTVQRLAPIVTQEAGLPLGTGAVQAMDSDAALAAYIKASGYQRGSFLAMDVGAAGTAMLLWLRGMSRPCAVTHLPLGIHGMLLHSLIRHADAVAADFDMMFEGSAKKALRELSAQLRQARGSRKALKRCLLLLDECLGEHLDDIARCMNQTLSQGGMTILQALLLEGYAWLMTTAGLALEKAWQDTAVNDYLPAELPLCMAGRGSLLLKAMPETLQLRLTRFLQLGMQADNAVQQVRLAGAQEPKLEVALGMARAAEGVYATAEEAQPYQEAELPMASPLLLLRRFLAAFHGEFPLAAHRLYPGLMEQGRFTDQAEERMHALIQMYVGQGGATPAALAMCLEQLRDTEG